MKEEVVTATKWSSVLHHLKQNRIEYLMCVAILHLVGITNKAYSQVQGVCI